MTLWEVRYHVPTTGMQGTSLIHMHKRKNGHSLPKQHYHIYTLPNKTIPLRHNHRIRRTTCACMMLFINQYKSFHILCAKIVE